MGCVLEESGADEVECCRKVESRRKVAGSIGSPVNAMGLHLQCVRFSHKSLLVPVLMYVSETMIWKEKSRIRAV